MPAGTPWLRLMFPRIWLGKGSYLRIVSVLDGSVQAMEMHHVEQWNFTSACFNGNSVMIEIVAARSRSATASTARSRTALCPLAEPGRSRQNTEIASVRRRPPRATYLISPASLYS